MKKTHQTVEEAFARHNELRETDECIEWTGPRAHYGHGIMNIRGKRIKVHRYVYERFNGPIPEGSLVRHLCGNAPCYNPRHLATGSVRENSADMIEHGNSNPGERNHNHKLTEEDVIEIRKGQYPDTYWAKLFGVNTATIWCARTGDTWSYLDAKHPPIRDDRNGLFRPQRKLTEDDVIAMRSSGKPQKYWVDLLGLSPMCINHAARGITWKHLNEEHPPVKGRASTRKAP